MWGTLARKGEWRSTPSRNSAEGFKARLRSMSVLKSNAQVYIDRKCSSVSRGLVAETRGECPRGRAVQHVGGKAAASIQIGVAYSTRRSPRVPGDLPLSLPPHLATLPR